MGTLVVGDLIWIMAENAVVDGTEGLLVCGGVSETV